MTLKHMYYTIFKSKNVIINSQMSKKKNSSHTNLDLLEHSKSLLSKTAHFFKKCNIFEQLQYI